MSRLTEQEQHEILRFIEADKPRAGKYRFLPFEERMKRLTATLRPQPADAAKLDGAIEPFSPASRT